MSSTRSAYQAYSKVDVRGQISRIATTAVVENRIPASQLCPVPIDIAFVLFWNHYTLRFSCNLHWDTAINRSYKHFENQSLSLHTDQRTGRFREAPRANRHSQEQRRATLPRVDISLSHDERFGYGCLANCKLHSLEPAPSTPDTLCPQCEGACTLTLARNASTPYLLY